MANFIVVSSAPGNGPVAEKIFTTAVANARSLKHQVPRATPRGDWALAAAFPRANGSGGQLVQDAATGSWLLAVGTWLDAAGGDEPRALLQRYLAANAMSLARSLEGFFCIVIGDARTRELVVITDVMGSYHAFVRQVGDALAVSGSSLLLASLADVTWDATAVQEFVHTGVVYEQRTCFGEVRKLPPATIVWVADGRVRKQERYWSIETVTPSSLTAEQAVDAVWDRLSATAAHIGKQFSRIVCDLTGGYDSRATVAGFVGAGVPFTATVSGPDTSADVRISKGLARVLGVPHHHSPAPKETALDDLRQTIVLTDGEIEPFDYARIAAVHRGLSAQFDISINGSYGEVARGYWWELLWPHIGRRGAFDAAMLARRRFAAGAHDALLFAAPVRIDLASHFAAVITRANAAITDAPNTLQMDHAYLTLRMQRWQGRISSSTNQLWPTLAPFLARSLLEILLRTPPRARLRSLLFRRLFARHQPSLARYPLEHGYPPMPFSVLRAWRFLPLIPYYGERVWHKVRRRSTPAIISGAGDCPRVRLWREAETVALLDPGRMRTAALFADDRLVQFLVPSRQENFAFDGAWRRLLALELTAQALERVSVTVRG